MFEDIEYKLFFSGFDQEQEIRRVLVKNITGHSYQCLIQSVQRIFPALKDANFSVHWKDREGDNVRIGSEEELMIALNEMNRTNEIKKLYIKVNRDKADDILHVDASRSPKAVALDTALEKISINPNQSEETTDQPEHEQNLESVHDEDENFCQYKPHNIISNLVVNKLKASAANENEPNTEENTSESETDSIEPESSSNSDKSGGEEEPTRMRFPIMSLAKEAMFYQCWLEIKEKEAREAKARKAKAREEAAHKAEAGEAAVTMETATKSTEDANMVGNQSVESGSVHEDLNSSEDGGVQPIANQNCTVGCPMLPTTSQSKAPCILGTIPDSTSTLVDAQSDTIPGVPSYLPRQAQFYSPTASAPFPATDANISTPNNIYPDVLSTPNLTFNSVLKNTPLSHDSISEGNISSDSSIKATDGPVEETMVRLELLGFEKGEWLRQIVESKNGNIKEVLKFLLPIPKTSNANL